MKMFVEKNLKKQSCLFNKILWDSQYPYYLEKYKCYKGVGI